MKTLNPIPQCIDCLTSLATTAMSAADGSDHADTAKEAERVVREILAGMPENGLTSVELANRILREIRAMTGISDPYASFKLHEMEQARHSISRLNIEALTDLRSQIHLSVLGNSLDFFNSPADVLAEIPNRLDNGICFFRDDIHRLEAFLTESAGRILYLTDNAGEIYFDLPLYDHLCGRSRETILVVKGGPAINDLTRAELEAAGLVHRFRRIADTGTDGAGVDWQHVSRGFLDLMASTDLVVAKGMANFETVFPRETAASILFLFKVKCKPVQDYIGAPVGSFMALWREGGRRLI